MRQGILKTKKAKQLRRLRFGNRALYLFLCMVTALVLLSVSGCSRNTEQSDAGTAAEQRPDNSYIVYYKNTAADSLAGLKYVPEAETFDEIVSELLYQLSLSPAEERRSVMDEKVYFNTFTRGVDTITVDLSSDYLAMNAVDQILLRSAVVRTLVQLPGVAKIYLTVEGQEIPNEAGEPIGPMDEDTFIETHGNGINSLQTVLLTLYFADEDGSGLVPLEQEVRYSSNLILEEVIVNEVIAGTAQPGVTAVASQTAVLNSISVEDGICKIDFDSKINEYSGKADAETALYAFVNSICENCEDVTGVQITIAGSIETRFRDQISLDQTFAARPELNAAEELAETEG